MVIIQSLFGLAGPQTKGFVESIFQLMDLDLPSTFPYPSWNLNLPPTKFLVASSLLQILSSTEKFLITYSHFKKRRKTFYAETQL